MTTPPQEMHTSDTEGGERPLRERLRNASIKTSNSLTETAATPNPSTETAATSQPDPEQTSAKLQRKRSHEHVESVEEEPAHKSRQARKSKRSWENSPEDKAVVEQSTKRKSDDLGRDDDPMPAEASHPFVPPTSTGTATEPEDAIKTDESPKSKRSRVEGKMDADKSTSQAASDPNTEGETTEKAKPSRKIPAGSAFANTSAASPFASLATTKSPSEHNQPASSAFASSAFGALAGSSTSAFGALGQNKTLSTFASSGNTPALGGDIGTSNPTTSAFGASPFAAAAAAAAARSSAFGSGATGFGKLGTGLGGGFGGLGGSKLTSFASSGTPGVIGSSTKTAIKAFGAPEDDEDEQSGDEDDDEAGVKSPKHIVDEDKKDERFFVQEIETGEEDEIAEYTCRAKLYNFVDKKEWKERGLGSLRLNVTEPKPGDKQSTLKARLVMRADGSHRVILNTPIQKGLKFGDVHGARPTGGSMCFMGSLDGKPKLEFLQLKARQQFVMELWDHITELQEQM